MSVDATKPADSSAIKDWPAIIRAIAEVANAAEAAAGGDLSRTIRSNSTTETLTSAEMNQVTNSSNASAVIKTLPAADSAMVGNWVRFHKSGAGDLTITPDGTDAIADAAGGTSISNTSAEALAAFIELECVGVGQWMIAGMLGTWA